MATGPFIWEFTASVLLLTVLVQFPPMGLFRLGRDTAILTSVATIVSFPFVVPGADRLGNREGLLTKIPGGLVGSAVGNYLRMVVTLAHRAWSS